MLRPMISSILVLSVVASKDKWMTKANRRQTYDVPSSLQTAWYQIGLSKIIPSPPRQARVRFGGDEVRSIGEILTPTITQHQPTVEWPSSPGELYSLFMIDPDAPNRNNPTAAQWYHWGVVNIPGIDIAKGDVLTEYFGAGPPPGSGLHRYVILVYKQHGKLSVTDSMKIGMTSEGRSNRDIATIAKQCGLSSPIAGTCFQAQYDATVPVMYKKLH